MARIDHHIHTTRHSPDSVIEPDELIESAREAGLDGVVITEHDALWEPDELAELAARAGGLTVLSGAEVSTREGHFLVYGLTDLDDCPPGVPLGRPAEARPGPAARRSSRPTRTAGTRTSTRIVDEHGPAFDALELASNNVTPDDAVGRSRRCSAATRRWERPARATRTTRRRRLLLHGVPGADPVDGGVRGGPAGRARGGPGTGRGRR